MEILTMVLITLFGVAPIAVGAVPEIREIRAKKKATEWLALSYGAQQVLGIRDDRTKTGYAFNMEHSVAGSRSVISRSSFYDKGIIIGTFIPEDIAHIEECRKNGTLDQAHEKTGFYPERVKELFAKGNIFSNITASEWDMIHEFYRHHLDRKLAAHDAKQKAAERVSAGSSESHKRVIRTDEARKQLRSSPEEQWVGQYTEDSELTH